MSKTKSTVIAIHKIAKKIGLEVVEQKIIYDDNLEREVRCFKLKKQRFTDGDLIKITKAILKTKLNVLI